MTQETWEKTPPAVKSTIINGGYVLEKYPALYHKRLNLAVQGEWHQNAELLEADDLNLDVVSRENEAFLSKYAVLITPTVSSTAPKPGDRDAGLMAQWKAEQGIAVGTSQFNLVGKPGDDFACWIPSRLEPS
jgi:Asp-tRNA(Asn)/Glu-tRNA(Gln) amidotransferase A subunit family amidase